MNLQLTDEQRLLREAAEDALARHDTLAAARGACDGEPPLDVWDVARAAGWSGLLVAESRGGAGLGLFDAMLVLEQCGRRLASAGLIGHLPATLILERAAAVGDEFAQAQLPALASGERRAATVQTAPPIGDLGWTVDGPGIHSRRPALRSTGGGSELLISGEADFQPDAAGADLLVAGVAGDSGEIHAVAIESAASGLEVEPVVRADGARPLANLRLDSVPAHPLDAGPAAVEEAWHLGQALLAADALGVAEATREMALAYAKDRHAFGRPVGGYQAVKHSLVEMLRTAGTARSLSYYAGLAAESRPDELPRAASCLRLAAERASDYSTRTCIAVHGGIGVTWEHDAPLYWRRSQLSRLLLGGASGAADRVAETVIAASD